MLPLFDLFTKADNGRAIELLARQYSLSRQQAELAVEALMPAFGQSLKRSVTDPYGVAAFMQIMASGQHARFFENPTTAFDPPGAAEGKAILDRLFGSKELADAVSTQAARAAGIGQQAMREMMPAVAAMLMGGLEKQSAGAMPGQPAPDNPFMAMMAAMMRHGGRPPKAEAKSESHADNPFAKMMESMFPAASPAETPKAAPANPYADMMQAMFGQTAAGPTPSGGEKREATANPYDAFFGRMFESGVRQRDEYQKNLEALFERFATPAGKPE